jgi:RNA recognition motif-containing protein
MASKLFVGNIDYSVTENDLQDHFGKAGVVVSVNILQDKTSGKSRGFGFVEMGSLEEAQKAIAELNQSELGGRKLTVNEARPMEGRPRGGGGGGGYRGGGGGGGGGYRGGGGGGVRGDRGDHRGRR